MTVKNLAGKPLRRFLTGRQLSDCRVLFRMRAESRGANPTKEDVDEAIYQTLEHDNMPPLFRPMDETKGQKVLAT
jgi:hypothetical protein